MVGQTDIENQPGRVDRAVPLEPATTAAPGPTRRTSFGMFLAIIAGLLALGVIVWPIVPVAEAGSGPWWLVLAGAGAGFLASGYLALSRPVLARVILGTGALALIAVGAYLSGLLIGRPALSAALLYLVPAGLALVAALVIDPVRPTRAVG
jgi:hypothetical protein